MTATATQNATMLAEGKGAHGYKLHELRGGFWLARWNSYTGQYESATINKSDASYWYDEAEVRHRDFPA